MSVCALKTETRYGKLPLPPARVNVTVFASVALAPPAGRIPFRPELPAATSRSIVATTSSAVKAVPSCHLTFWRRSNVQTVPSVFGVHLSARPGAMSLPFGSSVHRNSNDWAVMPYPPRSCIATGSIETGRWIAMRMLPPWTAAEAGAEAPALAAVVGAAEPPAAVADGEVVEPPHAAMTALIEPIERPTIAARDMNSRRLSRPAAK